MKFCFQTKQFTEIDTDKFKPALIDATRTLSWFEFYEEVDLLIDFFKKNDLLKTTKPVLIYGHKQAEMLVAMYACISMKLTYIPIDLIYPKERIEKICSISDVEIIINCTKEALGIKKTNELFLSNKLIELVYSSVISNINHLDIDDPLIYLLFTSGSTGEPKGVQISTEAIQSFSRWMTSDFGFTKEDIFFNSAVFSFDLSVFEIISFASLGATLVLNEKECCENQDALLNRLEKTKATVWISTPSFAFIFSRIMDDERFRMLKFFLFCGEVLTNSLAKTIKKHLPEVTLFNTYGPTEATVATTIIEITPEIIATYNPLPVGYPKREAQILIDKSESEESGEIIIVGPHVSKGYLNRDDLNLEKYFLKENLRAFKTGDLGYFKDGMLFCSGRNDDQVKWNGFRIELNEITKNILKINGVIEAVTIPLKRNQEVKKIITFVILSKKKEKDVMNTEFKNLLSNHLPYYMIPGDIESVEEFPYNQNFKIDKVKLIEEYLKRQFS
jgi:D-alanine--poly(phosphoribitol) ligase subunit 1